MGQPISDLPQPRSSQEAAAAVRACAGDIVRRWRDALPGIQPHPHEPTLRLLEAVIPALLERIARALESGKPARCDQDRRRFDQDFDLGQLLAGYQALRGTIPGQTATALKRALTSDEVKTLNLEIDVDVLDAAVAHADRQAAELKVEAAAMMKFLSFLSHDLRGGLNGAVLMIEVLKRELSNQPQFVQVVEDLETVRRSILESVATLERFVHTEKLRHGRITPRLEPVGMLELLTAVARGFVFRLKETSMDVDISAPADLSIISDRQLLTMVVQNLLSNAIKFSRRGVVKMTAQTAELPPDVGCRLSVIDQGVGLSPEKLADVFAPLARGAPYDQKGVGMGLYVARQAANLLGARLWAQSVVGQGSTFHLDLPVR